MTYRLQGGSNMQVTDPPHTLTCEHVSLSLIEFR